MNLIEKILKETKFGEERPKEAAGAVIICPGTKRALINKRGPDCDEPNTWASFGGGVDEDDKSTEDAVKRELREEAGFEGEISLMLAYTHKEKHFTFYNYLGFVDEEFKPKINDESSDYAWCTWEELWEIEPKHPGFAEFLEKAGDMLKPFLTPKDTLVEKILRESNVTLSEFKSQIDSLVNEFEAKGLSLIVNVSRHGAAELDSIKVKDPKQKNKGLGSAFMQRFIDLCDQFQMIAVLTPTTEWGSRKTRLINFYKRFGFVNNSGRNKDYRFISGMIRQPQ